MKKTIFAFIIVPFMCMGMDQQMKNNLSASSLITLPKELQSFVVGFYSQQPPYSIVQSRAQDNTYYALTTNENPFTPPQEENPGNEIVLTQFQQGYISPVNLNPCDVSYDAGAKCNFFSLQCWRPFVVTQQGDKARMLKVDDDANKKRFLTRLYFECEKLCFDGPNDNNFFIMTGKKTNKDKDAYFYLFRKYTEEIVKQYYEKSTLYLPEVCRSEGDWKYVSSYDDSFDHEVKTCALCKTVERYALVDEKDIAVYEMPINTFWYSPKWIARGNFEEELQKVAFVTPNTLLALSQKGNLFSAAIKDGNVVLHKQIIKQDQQVLTFKNFAVDAHNPHYIILQNDFDDIIFWDLSGCNKSLKKPFILLKDKKADFMWFSNGKICLASKAYGAAIEIATAKSKYLKTPELVTEHYRMHVLE